MTTISPQNNIQFYLVDESPNQPGLPTNELFNDTGGFPYKVGLVIGVAVGLTGLTISFIMTSYLIVKLR